MTANHLSETASKISTETRTAGIAALVSEAIATLRREHKPDTSKWPKTKRTSAESGYPALRPKQKATIPADASKPIIPVDPREVSTQYFTLNYGNADYTFMFGVEIGIEQTPSVPQFTITTTTKTPTQENTTKGYISTPEHVEGALTAARDFFREAANFVLTNANNLTGPAAAEATTRSLGTALLGAVSAASDAILGAIKKGTAFDTSISKLAKLPAGLRVAHSEIPAHPGYTWVDVGGSLLEYRHGSTLKPPDKMPVDVQPTDHISQLVTPQGVVWTTFVLTPITNERNEVIDHTKTYYDRDKSIVAITKDRKISFQGIYAATPVETASTPELRDMRAELVRVLETRSPPANELK